MDFENNNNAAVDAVDAAVETAEKVVDTVEDAAESAADAVDNGADKVADMDPAGPDDITDVLHKKGGNVNGKPLSLYGIGPKWGIPCIALTVIGVVAGHLYPISTGIPTNKILRYSYIGLGIILIILCVKMWVDAVVNANLDANIISNKLVTTGIYKYTRNPIYAAILGILTGILFVSGNTYMYILPIGFWIFLTEMLKRTEEVWLLEKFGDEYSEYYSKTNRIFPGPQKKK